MRVHGKLIAVSLLLSCAVMAFACKPGAPAGRQTLVVFPGSDPVPAATDSVNCENISNANPLPAFNAESGWLPYEGQVFCNYMAPHWEKVPVAGHGLQNLEGCNYFLMPEMHKKPASDGKYYSNRYYPDEPLFQSWFAVYSVAPMNINGKLTKVPVKTAIELVYRDNVAWAQWMGDPGWEKLWLIKELVMTRTPEPTCTRKGPKGECIMWKAEYEIPSHLDMGCCNWTAGTISNSWKVYHSPEVSCYPNPCGDPRKNCAASRCDSCVSDIWRSQVDNYQKNVRHPIFSYFWYVGDALMVSIGTGAIFKKKGSTTPTNTFTEFPAFKADLEKMTQSITIYYDPLKPFMCNSTSFSKKFPAPTMPPSFFPADQLEKFKKKK